MGMEGLFSLCGLSFKNLNEHLKTIHEQKASGFNCDKCVMSFRNKKYLNHHISQVQQEKIFCDMCGKSFTRINNLKRHINLTHKQIKVFFLYQCEYCEGTFMRATTLEKHKLIIAK